VARGLALAGHALEARDRALAFDPRGTVVGQSLDQASDAIADLKREVGGGGPLQLPDVLDRDPVAGCKAVRLLGAAQSNRPFAAAVKATPAA
jgi:hypothetical protein